AAVGIAVFVMLVVVLGGYTAILPELSAFFEREPAYPNIVSIATFSLTVNAAGWLILLFAAAPSIAAVLVILTSKTFSARNFFARLLPVGPDYTSAPVRAVYLAIFGVYGLVLALYLGVTVFNGAEELISRTWGTLGGSWPLIVAWCVIAPCMDEGGMLEELGWRGFAWPALQALLSSPLKAAMVLGVLWWAWHLPREISALTGQIDVFTWAWHQSVFLLLCLAESVICGYLVNLCGGSVLPAVLVHGGSNVWSKAAAAEMNGLFGGVDVRLLILLCIAAWILYVSGSRLGRQQPSPNMRVAPQGASS
ncbi:MAG: CPBP family glutamic-type intramembrane protease, partial [Pseudomonadota bacterium]